MSVLSLGIGREQNLAPDQHDWLDDLPSRSSPHCYASLCDNWSGLVPDSRIATACTASPGSDAGNLGRSRQAAVAPSQPSGSATDAPPFPVRAMRELLT